MLKIIQACTQYLVPMLVPIVAFLGGSYVTSQHYEKVRASYEASVHEQYTKILKEREEQSLTLQREAQEAAQEAHDEVRRVQERHAEVLRRALAIVRERYDTEQLQHTSGLAGSEISVSDSASSAAGDLAVSGCKPCICAGDDRGKLQRVLEKQLSIAAECDQQAARLRQIIVMYQQARGAINSIKE